MPTQTPIAPFVGSPAYNDFYDRVNKLLGITPKAQAATSATRVGVSSPSALGISSQAAKKQDATKSTPVKTSSAPTPTQKAAPAAPASTSGDYVIASGDTLSSIAARNGTTVAALAAANGIKDPNVIRAGATLKLPGASAAAPAAAATPAPAPRQKTKREEIEDDLGLSDAELAAFARPSKSAQEMYDDAYAAAGLGELKKRIESFTKSIAEKRQAFTDSLGEINENPFLTEQSRVGRGKRLLDQAEQSLSNDLTLLAEAQDQYDNGINEVNNMITRTQADFSQDADTAYKKLVFLQGKAESRYGDYENSRKAPDLVGSASTGYFRWDPETQKLVQVIAPKVDSSGGGYYGGGSNTSSAPAKTLAEFVREKEEEKRMDIVPGSSLYKEIEAEYERTYANAANNEPLWNLQDEDIRDLQQAGLTGAPPSVQNFFLNSPSEFRDMIQRKHAAGEVGTLTLDALSTLYTDWYNQKSTGGTRDWDSIINGS